MATSIALSAAENVTTHFCRERTHLGFSKGSSFPCSSAPHRQLQLILSSSPGPSKIPLLAMDTVQICSVHSSSPIASPAVVVLEEEISLPPVPVIGIRRILLWVLAWTPLSLLIHLLACGAASAAATGDSIRASGIGLKIAAALRGSGWADEAIVFSLATLPVLELRGAIPLGYWMQLDPLCLTVLSILGNMVPVPFIVLYLKQFASFLSRNNASATQFLDILFKRAREKAGPVEEFQWLGLMLFVAVPFPGTGAWTGAIVASVLDMPFWSAVSANFFGVVLAGLLVNLLVNLGLKYAITTGLLLFLVSTFMWSILRYLKKSLRSK